MKTEEILIIGGVGTSLNVAEQINDAFYNYNNPQRVVGFCIDSFPVNDCINDIPVVCNTNTLKDYLKQNKSYKVIFCLFRPDLMQERYELLVGLNIDNDRFTNFIHPTSYVSSSVSLGIGNVILSNSSIQSNVNIDNYNIINSNVCIEHDSSLGQANFIAANVVLGAKVLIKDYNFIGLNASVREDVMLDNVFVGMHSAVLSNYSNARIWGIPAMKK